MSFACRVCGLGVLLGMSSLVLGARERVVLKDGKSHTGRVVEKGDTLIIYLDLGENLLVEVNKSDVKKRDLLPSLKEEFEDRLARVGKKNPNAMYQLARWCALRNMNDQARRLCRQILQMAPNHSGAAAVLESLPPEKPTTRPAATGEPRATDRGSMIAPLPPRLTREEVNRIRLLELPRMPPAERVSAKVSRAVKDAFLERMRGEPHFQTDRDRKDFIRAPAYGQIQTILRYTGDRFADPDKYPNGMVIRSDPAVFSEFRRRIQPIVLKGCATVACHGGPEARAIRLYTEGTKVSAEVDYTNFMILDSYAYTRYIKGRGLGKGKVTRRIIERGNAEASLLLTYGLPHEESDTPHPKNPIQTLFRRGGRKYNRVRDWIKQLQVPRPDYKLKWKPFPSEKQRKTQEGRAPARR